MSRAMLFELAIARAEALLLPSHVSDWQSALETAVSRQKRHFDARTPACLYPADKKVASLVSRNLVSMLKAVEAEHETSKLVIAPKIAGYQWIASTVGDFAVGTTLIEVKCTSENFSSADYRQILIYWLLSYAESLESPDREWFSQLMLVNPRRCTMIAFDSDYLVQLLAGGRSKVELFELFAAVVDGRDLNRG